MMKIIIQVPELELRSRSYKRSNEDDSFSLSDHTGYAPKGLPNKMLFTIESSVVMKMST